MLRMLRRLCCTTCFNFLLDFEDWKEGLFGLPEDGREKTYQHRKNVCTRYISWITEMVSCAALRHLVIVSESCQVVSVSVCGFVSGVSDCFSGFCPGLELDWSPPGTAVECRRKGLKRSVLTL